MQSKLTTIETLNQTCLVQELIAAPFSSTAAIEANIPITNVNFLRV